MAEWTRVVVRTHLDTGDITVYGPFESNEEQEEFWVAWQVKDPRCRWTPTHLKPALKLPEIKYHRESAAKYSIRQVAEMLATPISRVRTLIDTGELEAIKEGPTWRIYKTQLDAYLKKEYSSESVQRTNRLLQDGLGRPRDYQS